MIFLLVRTRLGGSYTKGITRPRPVLVVRRGRATFFTPSPIQSSKVARLAFKHQTLNTQNITASSGRQTSNTQNITASYQLHIYLLTTFTV